METGKIRTTLFHAWTIVATLTIATSAHAQFNLGPEVGVSQSADTQAPSTTFPNRSAPQSNQQGEPQPSALNAGAANDLTSGVKQAQTDAGGRLNMARNFLDVLYSAGIMMFPILGCSVVLLMFVLERMITLRRSRVIPKHFVKLFLNELDEGQLKPAEALELCEENNSPISEVFAAAVKKWNRPSVEIEQAVIDAGERVANGLRRYLRLFNGIATVSPLLGLLGTVLGMIQAFNAIASADAMGRPEVLAEGISEALLTTAGGLSVAIPAFIAYMYFTSRVDRLIIEIDGLGQNVVSAIASDAWQAKSSRKKTSKAA